MATPVVSGTLVAPLRRISPCNCTVPWTDSSVTRNFRSARFTVYGTGGVSNLLTGLLASSKSRLYSSRGSVTLPEAGTGGGVTSSAAAARPGRISIQAKKIANIFFICHLPFCRVDKLTLQRELDFQRLVQK